MKEEQLASQTLGSMREGIRNPQSYRAISKAQTSQVHHRAKRGASAVLKKISLGDQGLGPLLPSYPMALRNSPGSLACLMGVVSLYSFSEAPRMGMLLPSPHDGTDNVADADTEMSRIRRQRLTSP